MCAIVSAPSSSATRSMRRRASNVLTVGPTKPDSISCGRTAISVFAAPCANRIGSWIISPTPSYRFDLSWGPNYIVATFGAVFVEPPRLAPRRPAAAWGRRDMEFIYFLGRFHVVVLHVPIGIIVALVGLEWAARKEKYRSLAAASPYLWGAAAVSALVTVLLGYMHFAEGGFEGPSGTQHRLFGTVLAALTTLVALLRVSKFASSYEPLFFPASIVL